LVIQLTGADHVWPAPMSYGPRRSRMASCRCSRAGTPRFDPDSPRPRRGSPAGGGGGSLPQRSRLWPVHQPRGVALPHYHLEPPFGAVRVPYARGDDRRLAGQRLDVNDVDLRDERAPGEVPAHLLAQRFAVADVLGP